MKKFFVTYRGKGGRQEVVQVEAASRQDVFKELAQKGISPIRVEEDDGKARKLRKSPRAKISGVNHLKGLLFAVAAAFVALAVIVVWMVFSAEKGSVDSPSDVAPRGLISEVAPAKPRLADSDFVKKKPIKTSSVEEALANVGEFQLSAVVPSRPPISDEDMYTLTNRTFSTGVEQLMSWVFTTTVGDMPMPLPAIAPEEKENIVGIIMSRNVINENDSEIAADCKASVDFAKEELKEYLKEGGDPEEFLAFYHNELKKAFEYRNLALEQAREVYEEDPELGEKFVEAINEKLGESGIRQLIMGEVR